MYGLRPARRRKPSILPRRLGLKVEEDFFSAMRFFTCLQPHWIREIRPASKELDRYNVDVVVDVKEPVLRLYFQIKSTEYGAEHYWDKYVPCISVTPNRHRKAIFDQALEVIKNKREEVLSYQPRGTH